MNLFLESAAIISDCGKFRYRLTRIWDPEMPPLCFVCLNPSTATATEDDPTVRRLCGFAHREGAGGVWIVNLFAYRSPSPAVMKAAPDPVGPMNDTHIMAAASAGNGRLVVAWGADGGYRGRDREVLALLRTWGVTVVCLGVTKDGHPRHPLYLASNTPLRPLEATP